jgi:thiamine-phosphate pyrophosphorylase
MMKEREKRAVLRILDANANRCSEGLRVIEEIARFAAGNEELQRQLKEIRHAVRECLDLFTDEPTRYRDIADDVGKDHSTSRESYRGSLEGVARANFARAEEALRVMEEFGKLLRPDAAARIKALRFELYSLESRFFETGDDSLPFPSTPFLYAILDRSIISTEEVGTAAANLAEGGAEMIQYRAKGIGSDERRTDLIEIMAAASSTRIPIIVNDDPILAAETGADGVHLGTEDPPPEQARSLLGPGRIIGLTVHSIDEALSAPLDLVDYIAYGSIFSSPTKPEVIPVGTEGFARLRSTLQIPVIAIGGITLENVEEVLDAGAAGIAAVTSLLSGDIGKNCFTFRQIIDRRKGGRR